MEIGWEQIGAILLQVATGVSLAACAGLRAFLPLLVVGVAGRLGVIPLLTSFEWMESTPALVVFGVAVTCELLADKFPVVDNLLDTLQVGIKPIAGAVVTTSVLSDLNPMQATILGILLGGGVAGGVHLAKANLRLLSSTATVGLANPVLSTAEDVGAVTGSVLALFLPLLVVAGLILAIFALWLLARHLRQRALRPA